MTAGRWTRSVPLSGNTASPIEETWTYTRADGRASTHAMTVTVGKPFDVLSLKGTNIDEMRQYAEFLGTTARRLYGEKTPQRDVAHCPCCLQPTSGAAEALRIFDVPYHRCAQCGHAFVRRQPTEAVLNEVFGGSEDHSSTYIDRDAAEKRIAQIVAPKLDWVAALFRRHAGADPATAIDVGAGGGHCVAAARRRGIAANGFELSEASRRFAQEAFGLALLPDDFVSATGDAVDLITMWGLLEYTPEPRRFLRAARRRISPRGMIVVEVPRFDALGTAAQAGNPQSVARHMDPTTHVNCFSDASLATALVEEGFSPIAAWYFGMDIYELLVQAALRLGSAMVIEKLSDMIPALQASLDHGRQCDDLVMAAVPAG